MTRRRLMMFKKSSGGLPEGYTAVEYIQTSGSQRIDTASDRKHVETAAGQRQCAEAIVKAVADFYGIKKKSAPAVKPSEDKPTAATVRAGDIVKIKGSKYATGQKIPFWVKLKSHTVKSVSGNRALESGKYYSQDGKVYRCTRDTGNPVYNALSELVGLYVEEAQA